MRYRELILMLIGKSHILTMCERCGCLVGDKEIHDSYHKARDEMSSTTRKTAQHALDRSYSRDVGWR